MKKKIGWFLGIFVACLAATAIGQESTTTMTPSSSTAPALPQSLTAFPLTTFYNSNLDFAGKKPGDILKVESIPAPEGADAWRIMYVSRTWDDRLVPVTGIVVAPKDSANADRPILNWTHGTTGGARGCAPSLADRPAQNFLQRSPTVQNPIDIGIPYLTDFIARGYVVVATDYYGLGGPGVYQYGVGETAARNGLDIARAARNLPAARAGLRLLTMGWAIGGQAALFTGEIQSSYAPEFNNLGVVAIAPESTLSLGMNEQFHTYYMPYIYIAARAYHTAYYASLAGFTARGREIITAAGKVCVSGVYSIAASADTPTFEGDLTTNPTWNQALQMNDAGNVKSFAPILLVQGAKDEVVAPQKNKLFKDRACKQGDTLKMIWYQGKTHRSVIDPAKSDILNWMDDRLKGVAAPNEC